MRFIKKFGQIDRNDHLIAGGKGASLGEMTQAGIPVPSGFVVLTDAYEAFLAQADLKQEIISQLDKVNHQDMASVERASEQIRDKILNVAIPSELENEIEAAFDRLGAEFVAVRSSATAEDGAASSWAGELDTFLNTTKGTLLDNVRRCWASLFTPRAIFYRFEKGFNMSHVSVAVVVQKMVQSDVAGVAFSVHPVTQNPNHLIIEAGWGLGEAVVSGEITPDSYTVGKRDGTMLETNVSTQDRGLYRQRDGGTAWLAIPEEKRRTKKLSDGQISQLVKLVIRIEQHYGFPCDIEWALEDGIFFILQSRPITTLA